MARTVEEIETDVAAVRSAWSEATEAARQARLAAEDLRRRAIADDSTVSAAALAAAEDEAKFSELKIEARKQATMTLDGELRTATAERFADEFETAIQSLRGLRSVSHRTRGRPPSRGNGLEGARVLDEFDLSDSSRDRPQREPARAVPGYRSPVSRQVPAPRPAGV